MSIPEIVVGIDFGTTYSGVAWALNRGTKHVNLIRDWENPTAQHSNPNSDKVPTLLSYKRESAAVAAWGFKAAAIDGNSLRWFKILLEPEHKYEETPEQVTYSKEILAKMEKTAQDAAADYLRFLWSYAKEHIRRHTPKDDDTNYSHKVVITVPAMWSDVAKERTREAAEAAGIPGEVSLVSEPEAAALAEFRDKLKKGHPLKKDDIFIICDAGGGTVDLISYKVKSSDPLEIEECTSGKGGLCGSAYIDMGFEKFVKLKVGRENYGNIRERYRKRMMLDFEAQVKRNFGGQDEDMRSVELVGVEDNPEEGIIDENVTLSAAAVRTLFDHVCSQVVVLVSNQIEKVKENDLNVKAVLLVGGFGASNYLHYRLENAEEIQKNNIQVIQNTDAWSSICRGATLWGLEHSEAAIAKGIPPTVRSRIARYSYGIRMDMEFDSQIHSSHEGVYNESGKHVVKDQMFWLIEKGDRMEDGREVGRKMTNSVRIGRVHILSNSKQDFYHTLWFCEQDPPPRRFDAHTVNKLCTLGHKMRKGKLVVDNKGHRGAFGEKYRDVGFTLSILLGSASLKFFVKYHDGEVARCNAKYREDKDR
jgi:hypothetical protein